MRWTRSNKPCEAPRIMQIRDQCRRPPRWSANLWLGMVKPRLCEVESVFEASSVLTISKRQYGMEAVGNPTQSVGWMKSTYADGANTSGYMGYKPSATAEGVTDDKMETEYIRFSPCAGV